MPTHKRLTRPLRALRGLLLVGVVVSVPGCIYTIDGGLVEPEVVDCGEGEAACLGARCTGKLACPGGFHCAFVEDGDVVGYCTTSCQNQTGNCDSSPTGTLLGCALPYDGDNLCIFFCKAHGSTFSCPEGLICGPRETPPTSDQYICIPEESQ